MKLQMEYMVDHHSQGVKKGIKRSRDCSSAKVERKIIEKNRRNHMKNLYSMLNSLLPCHDSKEPLPLPDQIDVAVNYIKSLQTRLKEFEEKKESLMIGTKTSHKCGPAEIKINEKDSAMEVALMTGPDSRFVFNEMIWIFHENGAQVLNANFWVVGDKVFHVIHAETAVIDEAEVIKEELKKLVSGSKCKQQEVEREVYWDYEIDPETWSFPIFL